MKKKNFADVNAMTLKNNKEQHTTDIRSSLTFLTFWPHIDEEYFQDFLRKNLYKKDQLIYHSSKYGKQKRAKIIY